MAVSDAWVWSAVGVTFTIMSGLVGYAFRLAGLLGAANSKADAAQKQAAGATARVIDMEKQLTDHRVAVAKDYVSNDTLAKLENRIVDAINRLGDRLDDMFKAHN